MTDSNEKLLLRVEEAREALGLGRTKFYELLRTEGFPVVRIGRCVRIPVELLSLWIAQNSKTHNGD